MAIIFPSTLTAGDSLLFESSDDSPERRSPTEFTLSWAIRGLVNVDVEATAGNTGWQTSIGGAVTGTLEPGNYGVFGALTNGDGDRFTVYQGSVIVRANPTEIDEGYDPRTEAEKTLDSITAAIKARVEGGVSNYSIEGRSATYYSLEELLKLRDRYVQIVTREKQAQAVSQGLPGSNRLRVRFW